MVVSAYISIETLPVAYIALTVIITIVFIIPILKYTQQPMNYKQIAALLIAGMAIITIVFSYNSAKITEILLKIKVTNNNK